MLCQANVGKEVEERTYGFATWVGQDYFNTTLFLWMRYLEVDFISVFLDDSKQTSLWCIIYCDRLLNTTSYYSLHVLSKMIDIQRLTLQIATGTLLWFAECCPRASWVSSLDSNSQIDRTIVIRHAWTVKLVLQHPNALTRVTLISSSFLKVQQRYHTRHVQG